MIHGVINKTYILTILTVRAEHELLLKHTRSIATIAGLQEGADVDPLLQSINLRVPLTSSGPQPGVAFLDWCLSELEIRCRHDADRLLHTTQHLVMEDTYSPSWVPTS